jgi:hypothetical protein
LKGTLTVGSFAVFRLRRLSVAILAVVLFALGQPDGTRAATPIALPGSRVALVVPPGFVPASGFVGYRDAGRGASIVITELKAGSIDAVRASYEGAALSGRGMQQLSHAELKNLPHPGFLTVVRATEGQKPFRKWVLALAAPEVTAVVTVNVPEQVLNPALEASVVATLTSVTVGQPAARTGSALDNLPFRVPASPELTPVEVRSGQTLILAGKPKAGSSGDVRLTVAALPGRGRIGQPETFTKRMALTVDGATGIELGDTRPVAADGLSGYAASGRCKLANTGAPCVLYHAMLFDSSGYYRFVGLAPEAESATALPLFQHMVDGFRRAR